MTPTPQGHGPAPRVRFPVDPISKGEENALKQFPCVCLRAINKHRTATLTGTALTKGIDVV
jgi:hypothetical protein